MTVVETTRTARAQVGADLPEYVSKFLNCCGSTGFCLANLEPSVKYRSCSNIHWSPGLKHNGCNPRPLESICAYARQKQKLPWATGHLPATHLLLLTAVDLDSTSRLPQLWLNGCDLGFALLRLLPAMYTYWRHTGKVSQTVRPG